MLGSIKERIIVCPSSELENTRRAAVELDAKITCLQEIIDLEYEDIENE